MRARAFFITALVALLVLLARAASADSALDDVDELDELDAPAEPADDDGGAPVRIAGPAIGEVLAAAYKAAGLDRDRARAFSRRARVAALLPWVTVRTGRNTSWQDSDPDVDRGTTIDVRATWRLDRLVFDSRELQAASQEAARRRERQRLATRVIRAYFHWQRVARAAARRPAWSLRADEAAAVLDALTDGWFSGQRARRRRREG